MLENDPPDDAFVRRTHVVAVRFECRESLHVEPRRSSASNTLSRPAGSQKPPTHCVDSVGFLSAHAGNISAGLPRPHMQQAKKEEVRVITGIRQRTHQESGELNVELIDSTTPVLGTGVLGE